MTVRPRLAGLVLALVTLLVYLPAGHHAFVVYDDANYLTDNRVVQAGLTWAGLTWAATTWHAQNWHPLTWLSHMLDCQLFGLDAGAHHLVSVCFHAANAVLLLFLLFRLTGALWPSAGVAALFAWHPLHVESVAWAAERKDVLSALFFLLTLWAWSRSRGLPLRAGPVSRRAAWYLLALGLYALGVMAKPMLVTLPFVLLLLDYWPYQRRRDLIQLVFEKWPFFVLSAASCVVTFLAQRVEAVVALEPYPLSARLGNALLAYAGYLRKMVWPADLAVVYPLALRVPWGRAVLAGLFLAGVSWCAWRWRRERPYWLVGWLWYLGMLLPVIGLVQVGGQAMADRYTYLPLIGIFLALAFEASHWTARLRLGGAAPALAAGLALTGCLAMTTRQLACWHDSQSLFAHALAVTQANPIAHVNLGVALQQQGRRQEAQREYQAALLLAPGLAEVHNNLGSLLQADERSDEALAQYREAARLKPSAPLPHLNLAALLVKLGQYEEAMNHCYAAARLNPRDPRPHFLLGKALLRQGRSAAAVEQFRAALRLDADDLQSIVCLARVLAADPDARARNGPEAVALARHALARAGDNPPLLLDTLAMALAETGRFDEARTAAQQALEQANAANDAAAAAEIRDHLRLYESRQPWREGPELASPKPEGRNPKSREAGRSSKSE